MGSCTPSTLLDSHFRPICHKVSSKLFECSPFNFKMTKHIHSQSQPKGHASHVVMEIIDKYYEQAPGFQDVFDEETFYIFATLLNICQNVVTFECCCNSLFERKISLL